MRLVVFEGRMGWYWRLQARNNRVLAIGGEPFSSARAARRSFRSLSAKMWRGSGTQTIVVPRRRKRR